MQRNLHCCYKHKIEEDQINLRDANDKYFHKILKERLSTVIDEHGTKIDDYGKVNDNLISFDTEFLGKAVDVSEDIQDDVLATPPCLDIDRFLLGSPSLKWMSHKSLGSSFFTASWDIIGHDITEAILGFFARSQMLK